ncbi:MAG: L-threonylcarbamoyladenylate synthase [bacterium]
MNRTLFSRDELNHIKAILNNGGVIAFPTDTVWGVGCLVNNEGAVNKIYEIKGRDRSKPLIILSDDIKYLPPLVKNIPSKAKELISEYMPGALTVVLDKSEKIPYTITSQMDTIGFRIPNHPVIIDILKFCTDDHVLATTSANLSGEGAYSSRDEVVASVGNKVDYVASDFNIPSEGKESTVLYVSSDNKIKIYRQGAVLVE